MKIRLGKRGDARGLAKVHLEAIRGSADAIAARLGPGFLAGYYRTVLEEPSSVVLCGEDSAGRIVALAQGTMDTAEHFAALQARSLRLLSASLPRLLRRPSCLLDLLSRRRGLTPAEGDNSYVVSTGPRLEFWGCLPAARGGGGAFLLLQAWLQTVAACGVRKVRFEVNETEKDVERLHALMGARTEKEFVSRGGLRRKIMSYELDRFGAVKPAPATSREVA